MTTSLGFKPTPISLTSRDRLFFDQFEYGMRFRYENSGRMRSLNHRDIAHGCATANYIAAIRGVNLNPISPETEQAMKDFADIISAISQPFKRIVYSDWQYFYSNDFSVFATIAQVPGIKYVTYHQAVIDQPRDTVVLKQSKYQWRSYFTERVYKPDQLQTFSQFLLSRPQQFKVTDTWRRRFSNKPGLFAYIPRSFFVDHHDPKDSLMLHMVLPGCVRKTMPIVVKP